MIDGFSAMPAARYSDIRPHRAEVSVDVISVRAQNPELVDRRCRLLELLYQGAKNRGIERSRGRCSNGRSALLRRWSASTAQSAVSFILRIPLGMNDNEVSTFEVGHVLSYAVFP